MEKKLNITFLFLFFVLVGVIYLNSKYPEITILKILKFGLEASFVGFIADSYAIYGLFYKLGPHTNIILRKRKSIENKVIDFVANFLLSKEVIERELNNVRFDIDIISKIENPETKKKVVDFLKSVIEKKIKEKKDYLEELKELPLGAFVKTAFYDFAEKFLAKYLDKNLESIVDELLKKIKDDENIKKSLNSELKEEITKIILENHDFIVDLIKKRLESISDKEFIDAVKKASWDELQWIRFNGAVLGFVIGIFLGILNLIW
jgi:uncharacterized membrane-anchored protein YjiN (DUF445 family)